MLWIGDLLKAAGRMEVTEGLVPVGRLMHRRRSVVLLWDDGHMAIERIGKRTQTHTLGYLNIYRDDLENFMRKMKEFGGESAKATVNRTAILTEPEDFSTLPPDIPEKLGAVVIEANNGNSKVTLNLGEVQRRGEGACSIEITSPDQHAHGLRSQVEDICRTRRKRLAVGAEERALTAIVLLFVALVVVFLFVNRTTGEYAAVLRVAGAIGYSYFICLLIWKVASRYWRTNIVNAYRAQRPTHWERHRIVYISNAVSIVVSLVLGGFIGYFVNQIS